MNPAPHKGPQVSLKLTGVVLAAIVVVSGGLGVFVSPVSSAAAKPYQSCATVGMPGVKNC